MGFKLASATVPSLTGKIFSRKYVSLGRIITCWKEIAGEELSSRAVPIKIHYRKPKNKKSKPEATLEISASSSDAVLLQYQTGVLLERINSIFGDSWITALRITHLPSNKPTTQTFSTPVKRELSQKENDLLLGMLDEVTDPAIKERLSELGKHIIRKQTEKK